MPGSQSLPHLLVRDYSQRSSIGAPYTLKKPPFYSQPVLHRNLLTRGANSEQLTGICVEKDAAEFAKWQSCNTSGKGGMQQPLCLWTAQHWHSVNSYWQSSRELAAATWSGTGPAFATDVCSETNGRSTVLTPSETAGGLPLPSHIGFLKRSKGGEAPPQSKMTELLCPSFKVSCFPLFCFDSI